MGMEKVGLLKRWLRGRLPPPRRALEVHSLKRSIFSSKEYLMKTSEIIPFSFEGAQLRVINVDDKVYFVAKDAAEMLDYKNPRQAVRQHCKHAVAAGALTSNAPFNPCFWAESAITAGGLEISLLDPQTALIPEGDLWRLIMRSTKPEAQRIEAWVMENVLPSIRKTGRYEMNAASSSQALEKVADAIASLAKTQGDLADRVSALENGDSIAALTAQAKAIAAIANRIEPPRTRRNFSDDEKRRINEMHRAGYNAGKIARELDRSADSVRTYLWHERKFGRGAFRGAPL
jgi:anti-repressor protein